MPIAVTTFGHLLVPIVATLGFQSRPLGVATIDIREGPNQSGEKGYPPPTPASFPITFATHTLGTQWHLTYPQLCPPMDTDREQLQVPIMAP